MSQATNDPSAKRARIEYAAGDLMDDQAAVAAAYTKIINDARAAIAALTFPLGSPAKHFDLAGIDRALNDLLESYSVDELEAAALEIAINADDPAADEADYRRDLALGEVLP